jgi:hypothetical protein
MCDANKNICDDLITKSYNQCPRIHVRDTTNILYANFRPDLSLSNCHVNSDFHIHQTQGIDGNCLTDSLINNIAKSRKTTPTIIKKKFEDKCNRRDPTHVASITDTVVPICNARVIQGATNLTSCMINLMQDEIRSTHPVPSYNPKPIFWGFVIFGVTIMVFIILIL